MLNNILPDVTAESMRTCVINRVHRIREIHENILSSIVEAANNGHVHASLCVPDEFIDIIISDLTARNFEIRITNEIAKEDETVLNIIW